MTINRYEPYTRKRTKSIADILYGHPTSFPKKKERWDTRTAQAEEPKKRKKNRFDTLKEDVYGRSDEIADAYKDDLEKSGLIKLRSGNIGGALIDLLSIWGSEKSSEILEDDLEKDKKEYED